MNAICKHLATEIDICLDTQVAPLKGTVDHWSLVDEDDAEIGRFDVAVIAVPAGQAATLLCAAPQLADQAGSAEMTGCWAVMFAFADSIDLGFDAAFVHQSPLSWIACNSSKPERNGVIARLGHCMQVHSGLKITSTIHSMRSSDCSLASFGKQSEHHLQHIRT